MAGTRAVPHDQQECETPGKQQQRDAIACDQLHLRRPAASKAEDQRPQQVGEHVDLEQPDESGGNDAQGLNRFAEEKAGGYAGGNCPDDAGEQPVALNLGGHGLG